jgi:NADH-quinone oxidoreductase subunit M
MDTLLLLLMVLPMIAAVVHPLLPMGKNASVQNGVAFFFSLALLALAVSLWVLNPNTVSSVFAMPWLPDFGISFAYGVDGVSQTLVTLTAFLGVMAVLASHTQIKEKQPFYYAMLFLLLGSVMGVFLARDLFLFFLFFELELIPMYFLIATWGGPRRNYAALKFVLYTLFGSVFLVASMLALFYFAPKGLYPGVMASSQAFLFSSIKQTLASGLVSPVAQLLIFLGFFIAFAVKLPVVPFHTWLPDAHVEAPTPVSMLLAGILLKMGAYGMLRFCFEWLPGPAQVLVPYIAVLGVINIIYTAGIALAQTDMKKLIAYSSVSHMGFVLLAFACLNQIGFSAAVFIMVSHGLVSAALFKCVGTLYVRSHSRLIADHTGVAQKAPILFYFFLFFSLASLGLPLLIGFAGESLVFYGAMMSRSFAQIPLWSGLALDQSIQWLALYSVFGVVLGAAYSLWLVKRLFFEEVSAKVASFKDAYPSEVVVLSSLAALTLLFGVWPMGLLKGFEADTSQMAQPYLEQAPLYMGQTLKSTPLLGVTSSHALVLKPVQSVIASAASLDAARFGKE